MVNVVAAATSRLFVILIYAALFALCTICPETVLAKTVQKQASTAAKFVVVPVCYLTDRNKVGETFGPQRKYTTNCKHDMYYGVSYVAVPNEKFREPDAIGKKLGWEWTNVPPGKIYKKQEIKADLPEAEKKQFFARLAEALEQSGDKRLCIFLHGGADPFEDSTLDAALMAYYLDCPAVIYAWPSVGKLNRYRVDEGNVEWTQEHFNTFLFELAAFVQEHPCQLTMVAHSMGNRLLARAASLLRGPGIVHDVALVSPDIDAETFEHYIMGYHNRGAKVRLYVSNKDKVLPFTQMLYGGYYRLGEGVGAVLSMVAPQKNNVSSADPDKPVLAAAFPPVRLEKIDFTRIDTGIIGHQLPFELVANMSRFNKPGEGLVFVPGIEGDGNKFARYGRWKNKLGPVTEETPGYCKRVIPVTDLKKE